MLYHLKGKKVAHSLNYSIHREGRRFIQCVIQFKGKEGGSFIVIYHSKGMNVVHSLD